MPQQGDLQITTEFGLMDIHPNEIAVIQVRLEFYHQLLVIDFLMFQ